MEILKRNLSQTFLEKYIKQKTNSKESQLIIIIDLKTNKQPQVRRQVSFFIGMLRSHYKTPKASYDKLQATFPQILQAET